MPDQMNPEDLEAKKQALMKFQKSGLFNPQTDDPDHLLQQPAPQQMAAQPSIAPSDQTMQANPDNLMNALKRTKEQELMNQLFPSR